MMNTSFATYRLAFCLLTAPVLADTFPPYDNDFVALVEMVYGEGILSQGGIESIDDMFRGMDLNGQTALDLGCGAGAYDLHLAQQSTIHIVAIDPQAPLIDRARAARDGTPGLTGSVDFQWMPDTTHLRQFPDNTFDIVFSKEALLHVPDDIKQAFFNEIYRVMKPGGTLAVMDWMHSSPDYTANTRKMMEMDGIPFYMNTPAEYGTILRRAGFTDIALTDTTALHAAVSQQNLDTIATLADAIKARFGEETYFYSVESWGYQRDAFQSRELLTGIFHGQKP